MHGPHLDKENGTTHGPSLDQSINMDMPIPDEVPDDLKLASGVIKYGTGRNRQDLVVHTPGDAGDFVQISNMPV